MHTDVKTLGLMRCTKLSLNMQQLRVVQHILLPRLFLPLCFRFFPLLIAVLSGGKSRLRVLNDTFYFDYYSFVVGEPVGLFNSSSEKSLICRKRRDLRGLGHLYGNCCGETLL